MLKTAIMMVKTLGQRTANRCMPILLLQQLAHINSCDQSGCQAVQRFEAALKQLETLSWTSQSRNPKGIYLLAKARLAKYTLDEYNGEKRGRYE